MQTIALGNSNMRSSVLGFGCSSMMGRVGRKTSLAALSVAYDAGITFFDTARSYGYGESEALLGEFLHSRRDTVLISTKFGILPTPTTPLKRSLNPLARALLNLAPNARKAIQQQLAAQSSPGHFNVTALHTSLETSLRALRTDYVDFLFLHEPPASVFQQQDLFAALDQLIAAGKVRCAGIASSPEIVQASLAAELPTIRSIQLPCNSPNIGAAQHTLAQRSGLVIIGNHPFGGAAGIAMLKARLQSIAVSPETPNNLREKLNPQDDALLADVALNIITHETPVQVVVPSMMQLGHLRTNIAAIEHSRFSTEELHWLADSLTC